LVRRWTRYIKLRPSKCGSTAGILETDGLSQDQIVTIHIGFGGAKFSSEKEWRRAHYSRWRHGQAARALLPRVTRHGGPGSNAKKEVMVTTTLTRGENTVRDGSRQRPTLLSFDGGEGELQGPEQAGDGSTRCGGVPRCSMLAWLRARRLVVLWQQ
jgi:hypothetical protein